VSNAQGRGEKVQGRAHPEGRDGEGRTREALSIPIRVLFPWDPEKKPENRSVIGRFERLYLQRHSRKALYALKPGQ